MAAFPDYLEALEKRLPQGKPRSAVAENRAMNWALALKMADLILTYGWILPKVWEQITNKLKLIIRCPEIKNLIKQFEDVAGQGMPVEALAAFYAYESQVPRIATEKANGLKEHYGASETTCKYFTVHAVADIEHTQVWRDLINAEIADQPEKATAAINAAEAAAQRCGKCLMESKQNG